MKLWQSLERADQPKTKPNGKTQAEDEDMGLFGEIKQKEVTREKERNKPKQRKVGLEWEPKEAPLLLFGEKEASNTDWTPD